MGTHSQLVPLFPQVGLLEDIHTQYPETLFVLSVRDPVDWANSVLGWADGSLARQFAANFTRSQLARYVWSTIGSECLQGGRASRPVWAADAPHGHSVMWDLELQGRLALPGDGATGWLQSHGDRAGPDGTV